MTQPFNIEDRINWIFRPSNFRCVTCGRNVPAYCECLDPRPDIEDRTRIALEEAFEAGKEISRIDANMFALGQQAFNEADLASYKAELTEKIKGLKPTALVPDLFNPEELIPMFAKPQVLALLENPPEPCPSDALPN